MKGWWRRPLVELGLRVDEDREAEGSIPDSTLPVRRPFLIPRFTTRERNARATWFVVLLGGAGLLFWIIAGTLFLTQHSQANAVARIIDYRCPPGSTRARGWTCVATVSFETSRGESITTSVHPDVDELKGGVVRVHYDPADPLSAEANTDSSTMLFFAGSGAAFMAWGMYWFHRRSRAANAEPKARYGVEPIRPWTGLASKPRLISSLRWALILAGMAGGIVLLRGSR